LESISNFSSLLFNIITRFLSPKTNRI
jgi:hypothetical protein